VIAGKLGPSAKSVGKNLQRLVNSPWRKISPSTWPMIRALKDKGVPMNEIAGRIKIKTGKYPSVA